MKEITTIELRKIQLDILDDVALFCELHDIRYFLTYGTLIGAIRHHGYIPWDDDIDIAMPRPDYERFVAEYRDANGIFEVVAYPKVKNYGLPFAKVHHTRTILNEYLYQKEPYGVFIDVFPIDGYKNAMQVTSAHRWRMLLNAKKAILFSSSRTWQKNLLLLFAKCALCFVSTSGILSRIEKISRSLPYEDAEKVGYIPTLNTGLKDIVDKNLLESFISSDFEGRSYMIPIGYDTYLRSLYGDYMLLPPVENRVTHHTFKAWWK